MASDPNDIDDALESLLATDATLTAAMPDGVWWDVSPHGVERFVLLSLLDYSDAKMFGGIAYTVNTYLVKAVHHSANATDVATAARRIYALLTGGTLAAVGYSLMHVALVGRVRITEVSDTDRDDRWLHRGGHFEVWMSPAA